MTLGTRLLTRSCIVHCPTVLSDTIIKIKKKSNKKTESAIVVRYAKHAIRSNPRPYPECK